MLDPREGNFDRRGQRPVGPGVGGTGRGHGHGPDKNTNRNNGTHGVLSGPAVERIESSALRELVISNSIPQTEDAKASTRIKQLSIAPLLARAVQSIHEETSVSILFG